MNVDQNNLITRSELRANWAAVKRGEVFNSLNTKPEDWHYDGGCHYQVVEVQCQLCETMINYQFPLQGPFDPRTASTSTLLVGRECVVNFYEAYFPNGLDVAMELMDSAFKAARKEVVAQKLAEFRKLRPELVEFLLDSVDSKRAAFRKVSVHDPAPLRSIRLFSTSKFRAALKRRGYLKPDEIEALQPNVKAWMLSLMTAELFRKS